MLSSKHIHFVGIKGVGVAPLAIIAKQAGHIVSGCDISEEFITDAPLKRAGIKPLVGFTPSHINDHDLVITTGAHGGFTNVEVQEAKKQNIPVLTQGEALGAFMQGNLLERMDLEGISIAGSHGKTTTTAMIATILKTSGLDPSYVIGTGDIPSLEGPGHYGRGKYFIAEADEYATELTFDKTPKFLWQHPRFAIFTNIEFDHPDLYESLDNVTQAFLQFSQNITRDGVLIACGDDKQVQNLLSLYTKKHIIYGVSPKNDYIIKDIAVSASGTEFSLLTQQHKEMIKLSVFGEHNAFNATGALIVCIELGLSLEDIQKGLLSFKGTKRRFEYKGQLSDGAKLYDDYAHHPTEIRNTLKTLRSLFKEKTIVCIFQPHTYSRTKKLFDEFICSFEAADEVILTDIYPSLREEIDTTVSSKLLASSMQQIHDRVFFLKTEDDVVEYITQKHYKDNVILITMGAGSIYTISDKLGVTQ